MKKAIPKYKVLLAVVLTVVLTAWTPILGFAETATGESTNAAAPSADATGTADTTAGQLDPSVPSAQAEPSGPAASSDPLNPSAPSDPSAQAEPAEVTEETEFSTLATDFNNALVTISTANDNGSRFVVGIFDQSTDNVARAVTEQANHNASQRFVLTSAGNGYYTVRNLRSGLLLDVERATASSGTKVIQWPGNSEDNQKWMLTENADGSYYIISKLSDQLRMDVSQNALEIRTADNARASQKFFIEKIVDTIGGGSYQIQSVVANKLLDIDKGSQLNGATAIIWPNNGGLNQRFTISYLPQTGYYNISSVSSTRMLDVFEAKKQAGTAIIQWHNNNGYNQQWAIEADASGNYSLFSADNGMVIDVDKASTANGTPLIVWPAHGGNNQKWQLLPCALIEDGFYGLTTISGMNLDIFESRETDGTNIEIWWPNNTFAQKFLVRRAAGDVYVIECINSGMVVDIDSGTGPNVSMHTDVSGAHQQWRVSPVGNDRFFFTNLATGTRLDTASRSGSSGANVVVAAAADVNSQKWGLEKVAPVPAGLYAFTSVLNTNMALDIPGAATTADIDLTLWTYNGGAAQRFSVVARPGGTVSIVNTNSTMSLDVARSYLDPTSGDGSVVQWHTRDDFMNQRWVFSYAGGGYFRIVSCLQDGRSALTVSANPPGAGTEVRVANIDANNAAQLFKPLMLGNVSYDDLGITLAQMTSWQGSSTQVQNSAGLWINAVDPVANSDRFAQFMDLRGSTGLTGAQLDSIINNTTEGRRWLFYGKGQVFADAARDANINEVFLLSHAALESGWGRYACGDSDGGGYYYDGQTPINGRTYPAGTYYNFFGIGAVDSSPLSGGRSLAVQNGWNSVDAAIKGGAQWIAKNYIYGLSSPPAQPTIYAMRWDYMRSDQTRARGWHQYATSLTWARTIAQMIDNGYALTGTNPARYYILPRYAG